jgi:hypothetical protein
MAAVEEKTQPKGKKRVSAVIGGAVSKITLAQKRRDTVYPPKGQPWDGVRPGEWRQDARLDETGHLPENCPVRPLGYQGEDFYFVDTRGQVFNTGDKAMGVERVQKLFSRHEDFLTWAWPSFSQKGGITGFKAEEVRRDLFAAADSRGPWSMTDMVRGRGAWRDSEGRLILHCGDYLWYNGELHDTGEVGDFFYARRPASFLPWDKPVEIEDDDNPADANPAVRIIQMLRTWNFARGDIDCMILLGWMGVALMGAALEWRPSVFLVGDAGTGKSELTGKYGLLRAILGRAMISTTNASEAGLYQIVGHDSLPISIDELEGEDGIEQSQKIIKMARDAASGSVRIRGGQDHKGVEFNAQSAFIFSAINPPPLPAASLTRLAIIQLNPLKTTDGKAPVLKAPETVGPQLLRRVVDHWQDHPLIYENYRTVLRNHGHDSRGQNTFGMFLSAAHLLLGDEGMMACNLPWEDLDYWGEALAADILPELQDKKAPWLDCIERIITRQLDAFTKGERHTVAQILEELEKKEGGIGFDEAAKQLANADIGLIKPVKMGGGKEHLGYTIAIPNQSDTLARLLAGTPYAQHGSSNGSWQWALRRGPEDIMCTDKKVNRVSIGGHQRRCTLVNMGVLKNWLRLNG